MVRAMVETAFRSDERFTQDEFRRWLDERPSSDINHYELIGGRIVMTPPAGWPHGRIGARLVMCIGPYVSAATLGIVLDSSAGFDLPSGDTVEPDVSFVSNERLAAGPPPERGKFLRIVPTLVVEILSRSTARRDRTEKKDVYAQNGVAEYWIVDPDARSVTVHVLGDGAYDAGRAFTSGRVESATLPAVGVVVEDLFAE
jgi:Uma2 family endonuclease